ncbi:MAG: penicillin-binding transpeptidase domain-containing protein [Bacillota bacterium]|jgi:penicillin-binding protein 2|nr:penicillin-binding transpeptidase domain-containing protein [Bacillota bacterium]
MSNEEKKHKGLDRYIVLAVCILAAAAIIIYNLATIQLINGAYYQEQSISRIATEGYIYPKRGDIFDRNGIPIAGSRMGYCVQYVDVDMSHEEKNAMFFELISVLEENDRGFKSRLTDYIDIDPIRFKTDNTESFIKGIVVNQEDAQYLITADQVFRYLRDKTFEIDSSYTDEEAFKIMKLRYEVLVNRPSIKNPLIIADDIPALAMAEIEERSSYFKGFSTYVKPYRVYYNAQLVSHVLGYVGYISQEQYDRFSEEYPDKYYTRSDIVGIMGIESAAEPLLRGVSGLISREVDESGRTTAFTIERPPVPGNKVYLTIDLELQKVAAESLKRNIEEIRKKSHNKNFGDADAGAVVVMDVKTGEILAMVSYPDYDPAVFLGDDNEAKAAILTQEGNPMWNRASQEIYAPGSTYKPLVAVAALESGTITPTTLINCPYREEVGGLMLTNLEGNQGKIALTKALATSSNMFFYKVGVMTGIDNIVKWAKEFGLAQPTGIEITESVGRIASREFKKTYFGEDWYPANTVMAAIGQLYNAFTPVQITNYISCIANEGKRYTPHLIKMAVSPEGEIVYEAPDEYYKIPVKQDTIDAVKAGMVAVTHRNDGTAASVFRDFPFDVAGKTGTSETGREATESSNGLFVCYAPYDDPQIAIAVVVEHGVWGSWTAPIAKDIMMAYFRLNETEDTSGSHTVEIIW